MADYTALVLEVKGLLDRLNIDFMPCASTLLGMYRDGKPLAGTLEFDILASDMTIKKMEELKSAHKDTNLFFEELNIKAFPNLFSERITLEFELPDFSRIELALYDAMGVLILSSHENNKWIFESESSRNYNNCIIHKQYNVVRCWLFRG